MRDALVVAAFDLGESLRSRRVLIFLVLYLVLSIGASIVFSELLLTVETELADQLLVARTDTPGSMTQAVMENPQVRRVLRKLVGDRDLADELLKVPPLALLYGWVTLTFIPAFCAVTSGDSISGERATGSARYALSRTTRLRWASGKLLAHTLLMLISSLLGALGAFIVGAIQLASFEYGETALYLLRYSLTSCCYGFAFLGLVLGVSQLTRSIPWSRVLALSSLVSVIGLQRWLEKGRMPQRDFPVLADSIRQIFPGAHRLDLWRPELVDVAPAIGILISLGLCCFLLGHVVFARSDA